MSSQAFDPLPLLIRYSHGTACGQSHPFDLSECPAAQRAAMALTDGLQAAGLAVLPIHAARFVERRFAEMTSGCEEPEVETPIFPTGLVWSIYHQIVRIRSRWCDGRLTYSEPMARSLAELILTDYNDTHEPGVVGALIEPEPAPLNALFGTLGRAFRGFA
ncbi:MAG: hypothetical protein ABSE58_09680 [Candidatus Limnocylindrales bacterium]|jgi:hypothetical protein